jgi:ferredoxin--NADP+ reductase
VALPKELNAILAQRVDLAPGLAIFRVAPQGWTLPEFHPGQYAVLGLPGSAPRCPDSDSEDPPPDPVKLIRRAYSIASSSQAREFLEFYVVLVESGALTPRLFALRVGDPLWLGPKIAGLFTLHDVPPEANLLMISTGTGLAPYVSMLRTHLSENPWQRLAVFHGARHTWDLGYRDELLTMDRLSPNFTYVPIISRPAKEPTPWTGHTGYVQELWNRRVLDPVWKFHPTPENTHVFLCGNPGMIDEMLKNLETEGFREHTRKQPGQVHLERYW